MAAIAGDAERSREKPSPTAGLLTIAGFACLLAALGLAVGRLQRPAAAELIRPLSHPERERGFSLYRANCAGCHGDFLGGAPGWRADAALAPALNETGHAHNHSDLELYQRVAAGVRGRDGAVTMPAFRDRLGEDEIVLLLSYMASWWPPETLARRGATAAFDDALCVTPEGAPGVPASLP